MYISRKVLPCVKDCLLFQTMGWNSEVYFSFEKGFRYPDEVIQLIQAQVPFPIIPMA